MTSGFTLDSDEQILRRVHRHWIELASITLAAGVMIFAAMALAYAYGAYPEAWPPILPAALVTLLIGAFVVVGALILMIGLWVYNRNYLLITTKHLIQVEQRGLFHNQVDQVSLGRIQDVSGLRPGMMATILHYGTVRVQSAGEHKLFLFNRVPEPQQLADYILHLHEEFLLTHPNAGD
jgi:hypothetical protein